VAPENHDVLVPYNPKTDPLADWKTINRAMINNDFNTIAPQCLGGIISHDPEEAIYLNTHSDVDGSVLNGTNKYTIHFEPNQLPDVKYFWSLTMYDTTNNLVYNPIDRWSIGSLAIGKCLH
jgi:hypothetical protein